MNNSILTIDGKLHHLKELNFIERRLAGLYDPERFYIDLGKYLETNKDIDLINKKYLTLEETKLVDDFVANYFNNKLGEANIWFVRAYIVGRLLAESDVNATIFKLDVARDIPKDIMEIAKKYNLTLQETRAINNAVNESAQYIQNSTLETQQQVRQAITETLVKHEGMQGFRRRMFEKIKDGGELSRKWERVFITETNTLFANAYLQGIKNGEYVMGVSMPDACPHCLTDIRGKVYKVLSDPPADYDFLQGKDYEQTAHIWEKYVWVGKSNHGRSSSKQKRIDPSIGNKKDNLRGKEHHEHSMPTIPYHPHCRCRWIYFSPMFQYVDKEGNLKMRVESEKDYQKFYNEKILKDEEDFGNLKND